MGGAGLERAARGLAGGSPVPADIQESVRAESGWGRSWGRNQGVDPSTETFVSRTRQPGRPHGRREWCSKAEAAELGQQTSEAARTHSQPLGLLRALGYRPVVCALGNPPVQDLGRSFPQLGGAFEDGSGDEHLVLPASQGGVDDVLESPQRSLSSSRPLCANTHAASPATVNDGPTIGAGRRTSGSSVTDDMVPGAAAAASRALNGKWVSSTRCCYPMRRVRAGPVCASAPSLRVRELSKGGVFQWQKEP